MRVGSARGGQLAASKEMHAHTADRARCFVVFTMRAKDHSGTAADWPRKLAHSTRKRGAAGLGSVAGFVLEGELELGAVGDRPALVQVNVLLDDLSHPQIAERPGGGPDRLCCGVFP